MFAVFKILSLIRFFILPFKQCIIYFFNLFLQTLLLPLVLYMYLTNSFYMLIIKQEAVNLF